MTEAEKEIPFSKRVWALVDGGVTTSAQLADELGPSERGRIASAIQNLIKKGMIVRTGYGKFAKTDAPNGKRDKLAVALQRLKPSDKTTKSKRFLGPIITDARGRVSNNNVIAKGSVGLALAALTRHIELHRAELAGFEQALRIISDAVTNDTDEPP